MSNKKAKVVLEYTGEGCVVPKNVKVVRFHPSVIEVGGYAFMSREKLREVLFHFMRVYERLGRRHFGTVHHYQALLFRLLLLR